MDATETARFLAGRPAEGATEAKSAPDARPWRRDERWIQALADSTAKMMKQAIDAELAPVKRAVSDNGRTLSEKIEALERRIAELEGVAK